MRRRRAWTFSRARLCRVERWSLGAWLARQSVRLVVGHTGRMVLLYRPRLSLSRSVCSSGRSRSASTTGCPSAATSANLVLLRQALGLLSVHSRVLFGLEGSASNTSAAYLIWFASTSRAISGVKYERETTLHHFIGDDHRVRYDSDRTDSSGDARPGKTLRSFCRR